MSAKSHVNLQICERLTSDPWVSVDVHKVGAAVDFISCFLITRFPLSLKGAEGMVTSEHVIKSNSLSSERSEEARECVCACPYAR